MKQRNIYLTVVTLLVVFIVLLSGCNKNDNPLTVNPPVKDSIYYFMDSAFFNSAYQEKEFTIDFKNNIDSLIISYELTGSDNNWNNNFSLVINNPTFHNQYWLGTHTYRIKNQWNGIIGIRIFCTIINNGWIHVNNFSIKSINNK